VSVIVDVGAHRGAWTDGVLSVLHPEQAFCFEPSPAEAAALRGRFATLPSVTVVECALGKSASAGALHVFATADLNSLYEPGPELTRAVPGATAMATVDVRIARLDDELPEGLVVDLLKIDVQGYEVEVLMGAMGVLDRTRCVIVEAPFVEQYRGGSTFCDSHRLLVDRAGFRFFGFTALHRGSDGSILWTDSVYYRPSGPMPSNCRVQDQP
jgi:FkbM family methyltransferase